MNLSLPPLIALQKLDLLIAETGARRRKIPEQLLTVDMPFRAAQQIFQETIAVIEVLIKERRTHEKDLEMHEIHTEKMKSRLSELKSNKEYQAHLFEIEIANKKKSDFEDKILLCMEKLEQFQQSSKEMQESLSVAEKIFIQETLVLEALEKKLSTELVDLEVQHQTYSAQVDKALLSRYNKIMATQKNQALVEIKEGTCSGCRLQLPPQLTSKVKRSQDLDACPYCHRMLYWEGLSSVEIPSSFDFEKTSDLETGESV